MFEVVDAKKESQLAFLSREAEEAAYGVLDTMGVFEPPIDPIAIAADMGVDVWASSLSDDVAGLLSKRQNERVEIYINVNDHPHRQRFTCAHELGHFYDRQRSNAVEEMNFVDYRGDLSSRGTDASERFANGFAAALLMPRHLVEENRHLGISGLARLFDVSPKAMENRLDNLRL